MVTRQQQIERRTTWHFEIEGDQWWWVFRRPDGTEERSTQSFESLQDCGADAMEHGYGAWKAEERRRVAVGRDVLEDVPS
jgi:hypothetical protein